MTSPSASPVEPHDGDAAARMNTIAARLHHERTARGLSVRELGRLTGLTASLISQLENRKVNPSVGTVYRLAEALNIEVDRFFVSVEADAAGADAPSGASEQQATTTGSVADGRGVPEDEALGDRGSQPIAANLHGVVGPRTSAEALAHKNDVHRGLADRVVHPDSRLTIPLAGGVVWELLIDPADVAIEDLELILATYPPGTASSDDPVRHPGREYGVVLEGALTLEVSGEQASLGAGDSISFDCRQPHRLLNAGSEQTRVLWVVRGRRGVDRRRD